MTGTIAARLGITPGTSLWFSPIEWLSMLGPLPPGVRVSGEFAGATVAIVFVSNANNVRWFVTTHRTSMTMVRTIWVCYPTRGRSDFTRATLDTQLAGHGLHILAEVPFDANYTALHVSPLARPGPAAG